MEPTQSDMDIKNLCWWIIYGSVQMKGKFCQKAQGWVSVDYEDCGYCNLCVESKK